MWPSGCYAQRRYCKRDLRVDAKSDLQVLNFVRLIATYDPKGTQLVSANLGGPGDRSARRVNTRERKDCIIDSGDEGAVIVMKMNDAIRRRKKDGKWTAFHLAINATKVAKVLEVSSGHGK